MSPLGCKNSPKKMATERGGLYFMFLTSPFPMFLDPLQSRLNPVKSWLDCMLTYCLHYTNNCSGRPRSCDYRSDTVNSNMVN